MIDSVVLGVMSMASGKGIPGSTIRWALKQNYAAFTRVVVVDGCLTDEAREFYKQFPNVTVIDSPWTDSYVTQYQKFIDTLKDGEWGLWLDDDELASGELKNWLKLNNIKEQTRFDLFKIPCILHLTENNALYRAAESYPKKNYHGQWTKNILFKKNDGLWLQHAGSHVIPQNKSGKYEYCPFPYYHMKSLESFVYNDVWQAFLSPEGQGYTQTQARLFKMFTACYKTTKDFKEATKKGTWPPTLRKFAWENRREYNHPISRLAWVYFILEGHLMPEIDDFMTWDNVKQFVLSPETMAIYNQSKADGIGILIDEVTK